MITKSRVKEILKLALPITAGLGSTFVMIFVDLAMVGRLGNNALAAIGLGGFTYTLFVSFVAGLCPAVQGIVARRAGENSDQLKCTPLNAGLLIALAIGIPLSILSYIFSPYLFSIISSDPDVTREGVPYLRILLIAIAVVGMGESFEGFWTGISKPKVYMLNILFMNCLNILLNYILIFGNFGFPALGIVGAGIASITSIVVGMVIYFVVAYFLFRGEGFLNVKPSGELLLKIFKTALPENIRTAIFSLGYVVFYWIVGQIGTAELAATNVLARVTLLLTIFAQGLGMASATLVSNALGKGDTLAAAQWGWDTGKVGIIWITSLGLPMFFFPEAFLSIFITDPYTISIAIIPLQLVAATTGIGSLIQIFSFTLFSVGDGNRVLAVSVCLQWLFFLPAAWIIGPYLNFGLLEVWLVQMVYGTLATVMIVTIWNGGRWKQISI